MFIFWSVHCPKSFLCAVLVPATELLTSEYFQSLLTHAQQIQPRYTLAVCLPSGSDWYLGLPRSDQLSTPLVIDSCNPWISIRLDLKSCLILHCSAHHSPLLLHVDLTHMIVSDLEVDVEVKHSVVSVAWIFTRFQMWMTVFVLVNNENVQSQISGLYFSALAHICL